jgi:hypothetical protein
MGASTSTAVATFSLNGRDGRLYYGDGFDTEFNIKGVRPEGSESKAHHSLSLIQYTNSCALLAE